MSDFCLVNPSWPKPRLRLFGGKWDCYGAKVSVLSVTPWDAYKRWAWHMNEMTK